MEAKELDKKDKKIFEIFYSNIKDELNIMEDLIIVVLTNHIGKTPNLDDYSKIQLHVLQGCKDKVHISYDNKKLGTIIHTNKIDIDTKKYKTTIEFKYCNDDEYLKDAVVNGKVTF